METKVEDIGPCKKKVTIDVTLEDIQSELEKEFKKIQENAVLPGFRKGKAPKILLEKRFKPQLEEEVKQNVISNAYQKALEDNKLTPLGVPEFGDVDFDFEKPLNFDITLEVKPEIEIDDYKGLEVKKKSVDVTDRMVNDELKRIGLQNASLSEVQNGTVNIDDIIICNITVAVDNTVITQDSEVEVSVNGKTVSGIMVPDLEERLKGIKNGEEVSIDVKLADDFKPQEHIGKDAILKLAVNEIKRVKPPKIDDEFAKLLGFDSMEEFKDKIEVSVEAQLKAASQQDINNQIVEKLFGICDFEVPEGIVNSMSSERLEKHKASMLEKGDALGKIEEVAEKMKSESDEAVIKELKISLVLEYIADKERLYVTDNEVDQRVVAYARNYNMTTEKMYKYLEKIGNLRSMRHKMREEKVMDLLNKEAKITNSNEDKKGEY